MPLIPRDRQFFDLFNALSAKMKTAAELLEQMFAEPARLDHFVAAIKVVEHEADSITHEVSIRIDKSFITPLDREDIHNLAQELDNVCDLIDGTARRAAMFKLRESRPYAGELAHLLRESVQALDRAVTEIRNRREVARLTHEVKLLEEQGDAAYQRAVEDLFTGHPDPIEVIKWKEIYDTLERAIDRCQTAAMVLESISIKNS